MDHRQQATQLVLLESELPNWQSLSGEVQQAVLTALSQMLLDALEQHEHHCHDYLATTTTNLENEHVS
jgi:hypothetical protein